MKRVVFNRQHEVTSNLVEHLKTYVIFDRKLKMPAFILQNTPEGWIFRGANNPTSGHSGYHKTQKEAIDATLECFGPEILEFDNLNELINYCKDT